MGTQIEKKCVIVSGAPEDNIKYISNIIDGAAYVIAADCGYEKCVGLGYEPDLIVGDFDSLTEPKTKTEKIVLSSHKDDTDTLFAVKTAIDRGFKNIIIVGAIGGRFDHSYSNVLCLAYCYKKNIECCIISNNSKMFFMNDSVVITSEEFKYFSLFAYGETCHGLTIKGGKFPLTNHTLEIDSSLCQSNEVCKDFATVSIKKGKLLVILSND